ncbi:MAG: SpoVR family protein [Gemmatimonadota bacterium]
MPYQLSAELQDLQRQIEEYARGYGLDFFDVVYEVLDWDEINEVAAYGGYPARYPHWRFGMEFQQLSRSYAYGLSKIYEMVINNDPTYAYLLAANHMVDQKLVMAHVCGHADFFKHNFSFRHTNRKMVDEMANHASRVRRYMEAYGGEEVEALLDRCLSLDNLIDYNSPHIKRPDPRPGGDDGNADGIGGGARDGDDAAAGRPPEPKKLRAKPYMDDYINPPEALEAERERLEEERRDAERFPSRPVKDVMLFLLRHAPLRNWERDVLGIVREEAYYFAPQGRTKIMNEGWACVVGDTPVFTDRGLIPMRAVVAGEAGTVSDGERARRVYDRNIIRDHETVRVRTRRGLRLEGSTNHRVLLADGESWRRLDEIRPGDRIVVAGGADLWPTDELAPSWDPPMRIGLEDVAAEAGVSIWTVMRHRAGRRVRAADAVTAALEPYESAENRSLPQALANREPIRVPERLDARLAAFLGYLTGDGHISRAKRHLGLATGDESQMRRFRALAEELFDVGTRVRKDGRRWRVLVHSEMLSDYLCEVFGLPAGPSAPEKKVPDLVLRSPEPVVRAFLRAYFDCDAYAGEQGVILSTASETLSEQVQLLLLNYGILSRRRRQGDGCWHVHVAGASAARFAERIGFGLDRKQTALDEYVAGHQWFKTERWQDTVVEIERGHAEVYDISVTETHRYAAAGLVNHNSFWHSKIMTEKALDPSELIDYADHHSGTMATSPGRLNPYKLGLELWRDIEERWDKGRHGADWEACDDLEARRRWDTGEMKGREKIFEVRRHYNDTTFVDEFLTPDFVRRHGLFSYEYDRKTRQYVIDDRDFRAVKEKLLFQLTNFGQPRIEIVDANHLNRGELVLAHRYEGVPLRIGMARETLENIHWFWKRPVHLETYVDEKPVVMSYDGEEHETKKRKRRG